MVAMSSPGSFRLVAVHRQAATAFAYVSLSKAMATPETIHDALCCSTSVPHCFGYISSTMRTCNLFVPDAVCCFHLVVAATPVCAFVLSQFVISTASAHSHFPPSNISMFACAEAAGSSHWQDIMFTVHSCLGGWSGKTRGFASRERHLPCYVRFGCDPWAIPRIRLVSLRRWVTEFLSFWRSTALRLLRAVLSR